jgi:hypothetical protein
MKPIQTESKNRSERKECQCRMQQALWGSCSRTPSLYRRNGFPQLAFSYCPFEWILSSCCCLNQRQLNLYGCSSQRFSCPFFIKYFEPNYRQGNEILSFDSRRIFCLEFCLINTFWASPGPCSQHGSIPCSMSLSSRADSPGVCYIWKSVKPFVYPDIKIVTMAMLWHSGFQLVTWFVDKFLHISHIEKYE